MSVTFNGVAKTITVDSGTAALDIRDDVYTAWVDWHAIDDNSKYLPAIRFSGLDAIPGGYTGDSYFLANGWKLVIDFRLTAVNGILFSDNYATPYWTAADEPLYPARVSSLVNMAVVTTGSGVTNQDKIDIIAGVWALALEGAETAADLLRIARAEAAGTATVPMGDGDYEFLSADGSKPRIQGTLAGDDRTVTLVDGTE